MPDVFVIGGPNGAGKTTTAKILLPEELELIEFINADEIALDLRPDDVEAASIAAGRLMIERIRECIRAATSFAFETTCASRTHAKLLRHCQEQGWRVSLLYLWLRTPQVAKDRVANRVREGGHFVPNDVIERRYWRGLANMRHLYLAFADVVSIFDNSEIDRILVAERRAKGAPLIVHDAGRWSSIERASQQ